MISSLVFGDGGFISSIWCSTTIFSKNLALTIMIHDDFGGWGCWRTFYTYKIGVRPFFDPTWMGTYRVTLPKNDLLLPRCWWVLLLKLELMVLLVDGGGPSYLAGFSSTIRVACILPFWSIFGIGSYLISFNRNHMFSFIRRKTDKIDFEYESGRNLKVWYKEPNVTLTQRIQWKSQNLEWWIWLINVFLNYLKHHY